MSREREVSGEGVLTREEGTIFIGGIDALVRLPLDQMRADRRRALRTALFISGYRGSPLGGLDQALERRARLLADHHVVFNNGLNEDLAATAVWGTQMLGTLPSRKYDGVLGMWYGKAPGVDRSGDALKHANYTGIAENGGVLALAGDDPSCKSSSLPSQSEAMLYHVGIPTLFPGDAQDVLDFGLHGFALSRAAGLWVGMKVVTNVADGTGLVEVSPDRIVPRVPPLLLDGKPFAPRMNLGMNVQVEALEMERTLYYARLEMARRYARENGLNRIVTKGSGAWLGILTAGKTYHDVRQAFAELGLDDDALERLGVRILKMGMIVPLEPEIVREFASGLEEIFVVEEKRPFLELFAKEALYGRANAPRIVGKSDERGETLLPAHGEFDSDVIAPALVRRLRQRVGDEALDARVTDLARLRARDGATTLPRTAYFCSGCPHNRSTVAPADSIVAAGIGCHTMAMWMDRNVAMGTHMGAEGAQWVGMAPFTDVPHIIQNIGDGTFFHSGLLAVSYAAASKVNITYKLLYNAAVAMTGGQDAMGTLSVPDLVRELSAVGAKRIIVTTDEPEKYAGAALPPGSEVWHRDRLLEAQEELARLAGVTVLVHDQQCAAEKRRLRGRGQLDDPPTRVFIDEGVCEGCGDCGKKSNCLSVEPVDTEFGRKTRIHQPSCNKDYSCLLGDCPSFVTVTAAEIVPAKKQRRLPPMERALPEPVLRVPTDAFGIHVMGIGGTGVVTVAQTIAMAAALDGRHVAGLDQTGLAQKGGPVISDVLVSSRPIVGANKISDGAADLYLGLDVLNATQRKNLDKCSAERTIAIVSSAKVPTGKMIVDTHLAFPEWSALVRGIESVTRAGENLYVDAQALAEALFNDSLAANMLMVGVAHQAGALPIGAGPIEEAIRRGGVAVDMSLLAFRWGRALVVDRAYVLDFIAKGEPAVLASVLSTAERALVDSAGGGEELRRLLEIRVPELVAYQSLGYARRYVEAVARVAETEQRRVPGRSELAEAVARNLFKLMAYKDEYEVARLHLRTLESGALRAKFGEGVSVEWHLHPPILRALGMKRKLRLGSWFAPVFRALRFGKRLRGTRLDPFGYAQVRCEERTLAREYEAMMLDVLTRLDAARHRDAVALANLPDEVRGYEDVKLESIARYRGLVTELRAKLARPAAA